jgi:stress response protein YsnF
MKEISKNYILLKSIKDELNEVLNSKGLHLEIQYNVIHKDTKEKEFNVDPEKYYKTLRKSKCIRCKTEELENVKQYIKRSNIEIGKPIKF